mmetsp:Transcript_29219/g.78865  ORF Transcript_29219/g.78865 Transcript_29219/m.78865 type:complete len:304 (+) Transcript_29219:65-976(+)
MKRGLVSPGACTVLPWNLGPWHPCAGQLVTGNAAATLESKSKTEEGANKANEASVSEKHMPCRRTSRGCVMESLNNGSPTSIGLQPYVKMQKLRTNGNRVSESAPRKVQARRRKPTHGKAASRTLGCGMAAVTALPSVSRFPSGKALSAAATAPKQPAASAAGTAAKSLPSGGCLHKPWSDSARNRTRRFKEAGKTPGSTQAQLSSSGASSRPLAMSAKEASKATAKSAAAMSKEATALGTMESAREAAPKLPIAGEGKRKGGLKCTPWALAAARLATVAAPKTANRSKATGETPSEDTDAAP